jgi:hypothetical protein
VSLRCDAAETLSLGNLLRRSQETAAIAACVWSAKAFATDGAAAIASEAAAGFGERAAVLASEVDAHESGRREDQRGPFRKESHGELQGASQGRCCCRPLPLFTP